MRSSEASSFEGFLVYLPLLLSDLLNSLALSVWGEAAWARTSLPLPR